MHFYFGTTTARRVSKCIETMLPAFTTFWYLSLLGLFVCMVTAVVLYKVIVIQDDLFTGSFWTMYGLLVSLFLISRIPYAYLYEDDHTAHHPDSYPSVSVIIAAYNEVDSIYKTIETCFNTGYTGDLECIVVNDGSTDDTGREIRRAKRTFGSKLHYIPLSKNGGKKEAMALGVKKSVHDVLIFVDSDSFLKPGAITHTVDHLLAEPTIGAVAGNTQVENRNQNLLTRIQSIHYAVSFDIYKAAESVHHSVTCCPGCFSAYRPEAIVPLIDLWRTQTFLGMQGNFGDDRSLTNFVLRDWGVVYCQKAQATTMVPDHFKKYWRQQLRWKKSWLREGVLASAHMWRGRNPLASMAFYVNFTFPFIGPLIALKVLWYSIATGTLFTLFLFLLSFLVIGLTFSLFVRVYRNAYNFYIMPLNSLLFICVFMWQMPIAMLSIRNQSWGTR